MSKSENKAKAQDRRQEIMEASIVAFAEHGYHNTTIQDIVDKTTFKSVGTIFKYFPKPSRDHSVKDDILRSIFEDKITLLTDSARQKTEQESGAIAKIKAFLDHHFDHLQNEKALAKVLQIELRQSHHFLQDYNYKKLQAYLGVLDAAIELGKHEGDLKNVVPTTVVRWAIFGAIDEISTTWVLTEGAWPKDINSISKYIMTMFIDGMKV